MRRALQLLLLATSAVVAVPADRAAADDNAGSASAPAAAASRKAGPDDAKALAVLGKIVAGPETATRTAAIEELTRVAPHAIDAIGAWLARPHQASEAERRVVLAQIEAAVPDDKGRFIAPGRQTGKQRKADDEIDWLPKLLQLDPSTPGLGEVIADIAAIRALSATRDIRAAQPIFDAAFHAETMIYRDECGRFLRKMEPYSIPLLTRESQGKADRRRYATFQLERLDRQEPSKALGSAEGDEALMIAILDTFRKLKLREAVHAVWTKVNDDRPRVRAAARATWTDYITGPPPRPAPKKKLQLPGGKLTKKEKPLWLTYRELADNELRQAANELLHEDYPLEDPMSLDDHDRPTNTVKIDLVEVTNRLFAYYDGERTKQDSAQWAAVKVKADAGELAVATAMLDRLIAANPERGERDAMATVYYAWGKQLEAKQSWADAAAAYSKAHGLAPKGVGANDALAAHHYTLGKALEADGKDGGADFRRAVALKPDYAPAQTAADRVDGPSRPVWMLYGALLAGAIAALLFAVAMKRRRTA